MPMNFSERLKKAREHAGLSQRSLSESVGMSQPGYQKLENGASGSRFAAQIAIACGVSPEWLVTGKGGMLDGVLSGPDIKAWYPILGSVPCGTPDQIIERARQDPDVQWAPSPKMVSGLAFYLRVTGDSMSPTLSDGDIVLIDPEAQPRHRDIVVVRNGVNEATMKRLLQDGDEWLLVPDNPQFPTKALGAHEIVGVAVHSYRELR